MSTISRYGKYSEGLHGLPHMGEVIADYRKRNGDTQETLAIVCEVDKQSVAYWESLQYLSDMDRRILLCKVLTIPPALLGLTWRSVVDKNGTALYTNALEQIAELLSENSYGLYEDVLALAHTGPNKYSPSAAYRFHKHQQELESIIPRASESEKDSWRDLLTRYYQHSAFIAQHHRRDDQALMYLNRAVEMASSLKLKDVELLGSALYKRSRIHLMQSTYDSARQDIQEALTLAERSRGPLKGSIYLLAAEVNALYVQGEEKLRVKCRKWQDDAAKLLYKGKFEEDETFLWFNLYAVHHERAKMLSRFALFHVDDAALIEHLKNRYVKADARTIKDAHSALIAAKKHLDIDGAHQHCSMDYCITESRVFLIEKEVEESAKAAKRALKIARNIHSHQGVEQTQTIYTLLNMLDSRNAYVRSLGVELEMI